MRGMLQRSIDNKEKIVIFYMDKDNTVTKRSIRVINFNEDTILAYCYWRRKIRTFKLNNILSVGLPGKRMEA
ncbi:hypothetical protein ACFQ3N_11075 [Virgibacillus byunsanensis]|uniref:WYL domain-containing protein n=1 Tax=Virgibacillus byunsanensis TaxID=570945 RepID=A0ABW3LLH7_9BACI